MLSLTNLAAWADGIMPVDTFAVEVYYRQGSARIDSAYQDNRNKLDSLLGVLHKLSSDSTLRLDRFSIMSGASPEGSTSLNRNLSKRRSQSIGNYLRRRIPSQASIITETHAGIDWDNLRTKVAQSDMPCKEKEEVLSILDNTPEWVIKNGIVVDSRKKQLMDLHRGNSWRYMEKHFFPLLRRSLVEVQYVSLLPAAGTEQVSEPDAEQTDTVEMPQPLTPVPASKTEAEDSRMISEPQQQPPFYMAAKTNLLYDALLVPNAGVEFYLGKGFSASGSWMYAWWKKNRRHRYWRIYGGELAIRKYFCRPEGGSPLSGHHLGVYGQILTYDFETGGRGYMGGKPGGTLWEKMNYTAGLEYGYSLPVARRLNIDFVIGLGYWGGTYYEYLPMDNHYVWQATKQRHWFGPTKAEISLVWLLGRGNHKLKKGGKK